MQSKVAFSQPIQPNVCLDAAAAYRQWSRQPEVVTKQTQSRCLNAALKNLAKRLLDRVEVGTVRGKQLSLCVQIAAAVHGSFRAMTALA